MAALSGILTVHGAGTVSINAGETGVTGVTTAWTLALTTGVNGSPDANYFTTDGVNYYQIAAYNSATSITLAVPHAAGASGSNYSIVGSLELPTNNKIPQLSDSGNALLGYDSDAGIQVFFAGGESWG